MNPIKKNAYIILEQIIKNEYNQINNVDLEKITKLNPTDLSDAVDYLTSIRAIETIRTLGSAPFSFTAVFIKSRGKYLYHEHLTENSKSENDNLASTKRVHYPIGSPFGFTENDWKEVGLKKEEKKTLFVVLGKQFKSKYYDSYLLDKNIKKHFMDTIELYNQRKNKNITLSFKALSAGLGEHLFNDIARSIIESDIAVFETSDLNPNVMLELGVALTWGIRVIPVKSIGCKVPPSDVSGQTWVDYKDSGLEIGDRTFNIKLFEMIERVIDRK